MDKARYKCSICGLHYNEKELSIKCHTWCSSHKSCNLGVASKSIEAQKRRNNIKS